MEMTATIIELDPSRRSKKLQPYAFLPDFQRVLATAICHRQQLFGRIGIPLDPSCFSEKPASLAVATAKQIERETGLGPYTLLQVIQSLRLSMDAGKCMLEELQAVDAMFSDVLDRIGLMDDDAICSLVVPVLKRRVQLDAAARMTAAVVARGDGIESVCTDLQNSFRLGEVDMSRGMTLTGDVDVHAEHIKREIASTGIQAIDDVMLGGLYAGTQTLFIGPTGCGKSMALGHVATSFALQGKTVAYATLELTESLIHARMVANLTALPINSILDGGSKKLARERLEILKSQGFKPPVIHYFESGTSTVKNLTDWVLRIEDKSKEPVRCLIVDYVDRIGILPSQMTRESNGYNNAKIIMDALQYWATSSSRWCITASQSRKVEQQRDKNGKPKKPRLLALEDAADSMHKVRIPDVVITINGTQTIEWVICKNRHGDAGMVVGPTVPRYSIGRVSPRIDPW